MRALKITGIVVGSLVLLGGTALAGTLWWIQNSDLSGLSTWAAKKQGYDVSFEGEVRAKLWPEGHVQVGKMTVLGGDSKPMFSTDEARVEWIWGGGLTPWNGLQVTRVDAKNPTINLVRSKDGIANWDVYVPKADGTVAEAPAASNEPMTLPLGMLAATKLDIVNLNATYSDAVSGQNVLAKDVNFNASTSGTQAVTKLSGTVNGQAVKGNLQVDVANLEDVPLVAKLDAAGLTVAMDGRVRQQKAFAGLVNAQTDNLKGTLDALLGKAPEQAPAAAFRLGGDVDVGGDKVSLRNFSTRLGELLQANGDAVVHLGDKPSATGTVRIQGSNLRQLAELGLGAPQPSIPASSFMVSTKLDGQDAIELKDLQASVGTLANAAGHVKIVPKTGAMPDVDATVNVSAPNLQALLRAVGQQGTFPAKPLNVKGVVAGRSGTYEVKGLTASVEDVAALKSDMKVTLGDQPDVVGSVLVEGANLQTAASGFGVEAAALPASAFSVKAGVSGKGTFKADDVVINLPQLLEATGKASVTPGKPMNVVASFDITRANLTALGYCAVDVPAQTGAPTADAPASNASAAPWSDEKINVDALRDIAFDITVNGKGIDCARLPMDSIAAKVTNTPSQLDIRDISVNLKDGGSAKLTGKLEHAGMPALVLSAVTTKLKVEGLVPVLATKGVQLPIDTNAQLSSRGDTTRKLAQNLDGTISVSADNGKLPYTNLLGTASNIAQLVQGTSATAPTNGNGDVDSMKARYTLRQGVATTDELTVATGNGAMTLKGEGTVDLPNWVLDYKLTPSLAAGTNALAIPVVLKGPLTAPKIGADPAFVSKLSGRLAGELLDGVIGKDAGKAVGGVLGGVISGQGVTKEGVGTLLNAFGKKTSPTEATSGTTTSSTQPTLQDVFKAFGR